LGYKIQYSAEAERQMRKLDRPVAARILKMMDRVEALADPRAIGEALHGDKKDYWKYRTGDWRIIVAIRDKLILIEVIEVEHRSSAY
jgi:mRNA interferase RelE/StbE